VTTLIGIDLGVRKLAVATFTDGDAGFSLYHTNVFEAEENVSRHTQLRSIGMFAQSSVHGYQTDCVFVESVIVGNNHKYSIGLAQTLGAVLASILPGVRVELVDNKVWKRDVVGNGNATKDQISNYIDVTHPAYAPLCEGEHKQDRYDAVCIGLYGIVVLDRARSLQL